MRPFAAGSVVLALLLAPHGATTTRANADAALDASSQARSDPAISFAPQVLTAETIRRAGVSRLSDLFALLEGWDTCTLDGMTHNASPRGLTSFQRQEWTVMLDGQVLSIGLLGSASLNEVPVKLHEIDRVEIVSIPQIHDGHFADAGLIHIHTTQPAPGLSVRGHMMVGNETGDPGPFRYTIYASPNINKIGPDGSLALFYRGSIWHIGIGLSSISDYVADPAVCQRNESWGRLPHLRLDSPSMRAALETPTSKHELLLSYARFNDYFFLKPFGREIPTRRRNVHSGINGRWTMRNGLGISYRLTHTDNQSDELEDLPGTGLQIGLRSWEAGVELDPRMRAVSLKLGAGAHHVEAVTPYDLSDDSYTRGHVFALLSCPLGATHQERIAIWLAGSGGQTALKGSIQHHWQIKPRHALQASLAYARRLLEEDDRVWYWSQRGYRFLQEQGVSIVIDGSIRQPLALSSDLRYVFRLAPTTTLRLGAFHRSLRSITLEAQPFKYEPSDASFAGPDEIATNQDIQLAGGDMQLRLSFWRSALELRWHYQYQGVIEADDMARDAWKPIASHQFRQTVNYAPVEGFSLWAMLRYRSATFWPDYRDVEDESGGTYSATVPEQLILDLAVQKWFWHRRLRSSLLLRNLLDDELRSHPIGASFAMGFFVQFEVWLDSLVAPTHSR
ncbi:MAG: hypothetical protein KAY24_12440 [Candidatus Eisenbacteria sp.]|nr:hypothetical protein [Candidatus Eisenbacteria bacterium]